MGAMDAMGISSPSVGRWGLHLKQEKAPVTIGLNIYFAHKLDSKKNEPFY